MFSLGCLKALAYWAGRVHSVGSNVYGQLGNGNRSVRYRSELGMVEGSLLGRKCVSIGTGTQVSFAVTAAGISDKLAT